MTQGKISGPAWQPIETAPKDGTIICVVSFTGQKLWKPDFAWWDSLSERWENGEDYDSWPITHWASCDGLPADPRIQETPNE